MAARSLQSDPKNGQLRNWPPVLAFVIMAAILVAFEGGVWLDAESRLERLNGWLSGRDPDFLPFLPFLVIFPLVWTGFRNRRRNTPPGRLHRLLTESPRSDHRSLTLAWSAALAVFGLALFMSLRVGDSFEGLPPAYHDEYSYLFQAETFLDGRWSYPAYDPRPELFHQMHVLSDDRFASRYFPGTGAWIAVFLTMGVPWLGHQLAQALAAMMIFWSGRELSNTGTGLLAGILFGLSPGLLLFSNLLLAHHPTLIGLSLFLWAMLRLIRTEKFLLAATAGLGLSFAMLCRPMTAAAFGLPFGLVFLWWCCTGRWPLGQGAEQTRLRPTVRQRMGIVTAMGIPIFAGFVVIFVQNNAITGDPLTTPYQLYTDTYTPRHVYGFNNVIRGEQNLNPKVIDSYDRWARNLTPELAVENVQTRIVNSWRWTLGIIPLAAAGLLFLFTHSDDRRWWLIPAAIVSLHVAHIPYWFSGIMGWHYVFETAPLWLLLFAEVTRRLLVGWSMQGRGMMKFVWILFALTAVMVNLFTVKPLWPARLDRGVAEVEYPRKLYGQFREGIERLRGEQAAIIFVVADEDDRSMDYISNPPSLTGPVLVARLRERDELREVAPLFPARKVLLFDAKSRRFEEPDPFLQ